MLAKLAVALALVGAADAQMFGMGSKRDPTAGMSKEELEHMQGTPTGAAAVDRAMQVRSTHGFVRARERERSIGVFASRLSRNGTRSPVIRR